MRAALLTTETRRVLALDVHHIVADGLSVRLLLEDLDRLYGGDAPSLAGPTFADLVLGPNYFVGAKDLFGAKALAALGPVAALGVSDFVFAKPLPSARGSREGSSRSGASVRPARRSS